MDDCLEQAQELEYRLGRMNPPGTADVLQCVQFFMLSLQPHLGLKCGIGFIRDQMKSEEWTVDDSWEILQMMACMRTEKLHHDKCTQCVLIISH
jgi:hypothetical protein